MNAQVLMRVLHSAADLQEQPQSRFDAQALAVAIPVQGLTMDVLHDEIGMTSVDFARIDQARDVRMIEAREDLALGAKPRTKASVHGIAIDDLDRNLRAVLSIRALGEIDRATAAPTEKRNELVAPYGGADQSRVIGRFILSRNRTMIQTLRRPHSGQHSQVRP